MVLEEGSLMKSVVLDYVRLIGSVLSFIVLTCIVILGYPFFHRELYGIAYTSLHEREVLS